MGAPGGRDEPIDSNSGETAVSVFLERAARHGDRPALRVLAASGAPGDATLSWRGWAEAARRFAAALVAAGHRPGEAVAVLAGNRPLWPVADLGTLLAGGVGVGLYPTSPPSQLRGVLADVEAAFAVADTAGRMAMLREAAEGALSLRALVGVDGGWAGWPWEEAEEVGGNGASAGPSAGGRRLPETTFAAWLAAGERALADPAVAAELERRAAALTPGDVAVLIPTSGSTGEPKAAMIPHRCLLDSALSIQRALELEEGDTSLSFLPFCHAAERVFGLYTRLACGMEAGMVEDHGRLWEAARAYAPTVLGGLPRLWEKLSEALRADEAAAPEDERARWARTRALGTRLSRLRRAGGSVPPELEREWRSAGGPILARATARLGGRVRRATSGGATLPEAVAEHLDSLGITVLGAYGLSEHLCAAMNRPGRYAFDAAGPPMPGTELRVAGDGEILLRRSGLTFAGYLGRPEETAAAFTADGAWLRTGDLGELDARGMLRVTGRKKELIALSGGKKVAPLPIEARLSSHPWIGRAVLHGEGRRFVSALLFLRPEAVLAWAARAGLTSDYAALLRLPELHARVQEAVDGVNAGLARPERVRRWALLERDLSPDEGELTPTLKVRRAAVEARHRDLLDALYRT